MLLSVVIPTYNERDNILVLLEQLVFHLAAIKGSYEIIVVDDASPDGTARAVEQYARHNQAVRLVNRATKRDLSTALASGFDQANGEYIAAMDADLQHDPAVFPAMLSAAYDVDLVVATRYAAQGNTAHWRGTRRLLSRVATRLAARALGVGCSDPLSGYFLLRRTVWLQVRPHLHLAGFKLLLEILAVKPDIHCAETGYAFSPRQNGNSKMSVPVVCNFFLALWRVRRKS
jgi:dolichol-phosphate mannosyltransferase